MLRCLPSSRNPSASPTFAGSSVGWMRSLTTLPALLTAPALPNSPSTCCEHDVMTEWVAYLGTGALVGFAAGLLGIGGGVVMVPLLVWTFTSQGLPTEHVVHLAIGTGLAAMVFTSISSMRAHHARGAVDWPIARAMSPGMLTGSVVAALIARVIHPPTPA